VKAAAGGTVYFLFFSVFLLRHHFFTPTSLSLSFSLYLQDLHVALQVQVPGSTKRTQEREEVEPTAKQEQETAALTLLESRLKEVSDWSIAFKDTVRKAMMLAVDCETFGGKEGCAKEVVRNLKKLCACVQMDAQSGYVATVVGLDTCKVFSTNNEDKPGELSSCPFGCAKVGYDSTVGHVKTHVLSQHSECIDNSALYLLELTSEMGAMTQEMKTFDVSHKDWLEKPGDNDDLQVVMKNESDKQKKLYRQVKSHFDSCYKVVQPIALALKKTKTKASADVQAAKKNKTKKTKIH
jgi:hypothetical protein